MSAIQKANKENSVNQRLLIAVLLASSVYAEETVVLEKIQIAEDYTLIDERRDSSIAKRIIKGTELTQYGDTNALEILRRMPGVTIPSGKGNQSAPGKGYTVVMIDGEMTSTGTSKRISPLEQISPDMIERIEVMTNGSAEHTAESMGGIVNVVLKKPKADGRASAKLTVGSYDGRLSEIGYIQREGKEGKLSYLLNLNASDNRKKDRSDILIDGTASDTDEYRDDMPRNRSVGIRAKANYAYSPKMKIIYDGSVTFKHDTDTIDASTYPEGSSAATSRYHSADDATSTMLWSALGAEHRIGEDVFEWKAKIHSYEEDGDFDSASLSSIRRDHDYVLSRFYGLQGDYSMLRDDHFIKTGFDLRRADQIDEVKRSLNGADITAADDNVRMKEDKFAIYVQDEYTISDWIVVTPGLRYETLSRDYGATESLHYFAPSLHALFQVTPTDNVRASVAKTVRLPRLSQLSTSTKSSWDENDIHRPDITGNPNLREEKALSYELRYEHFFADKGVASIGGFYRNIDDKIENIIRYVSGNGRYVQTPENAGEGSLWGVELEFKKSLAQYVEGVGVFANATLQNSSLTNTFTGVKREILQTPNYLYNIGFDHVLKENGVSYGAAYRYVGGYDDPEEYLISQSQQGYGTLDVYASKRINKTFKFQLNVKNITGATIETTSRLYDSVGAITQTQIDKEHSEPQILFTIEGKW